MGSTKSYQDLELENADPGTIKIDCSGAYIGNDFIFREQYSSTPSTSPSPQSSDVSSGLEEERERERDGWTKEELGTLGTQGPRGPLGPPGSEDRGFETQEDEEEVASCNGSKAVCETYNEVVVREGDVQLTPTKRHSGYDIFKNITLPRHNSEIIHISIDIGGTLTKLVYFTKSRKHDGRGGGKLHFKDFQTGRFESEVLDFIIRLIHKSISKKAHPPITYIMATGGGAHKFHGLMTDTFRKHKLPMKTVAKDEMECLIKGLNWFITKIPNEVFTFDLDEGNAKFIRNPISHEDDLYPYLLVNIGSGVSIIKVTGPGPQGFERIGGSSLGGGTLWGLLSLITDAKDYNEMLEMAQRGNNENIDLLVGDIYGTSYNKIGLKSNHIASSFAKVFKKLRFNKNSSATNQKVLTPAEKLAQFKPEDIARSLLYLISNNIGQIAYLHALRFNLKRIYFGGSYISGHKQTIHTLSFSLNFWSGGEMKSYFLRHEGYLGSVGAFMMGPNSDSINKQL